MINWGIIGCGDVAEVKSGPAFQQVEDSALIAVMRRNGDLAEDFAKRHQVPHWYTNAEALLANDEVNAVYVATPPSTHLEYARAALEAGKDVYLEKPMASTLEQATEIANLASASDCKVVVAHYRRELPAFRKVQQLLADGAIGRVCFADIQILQPQNSSIIASTAENWRLDPSVSGGGYFYDLAPHQIDLMCQYFGPVQRASGASGNVQGTSGAPNITSGFIEFESGVQFRGIWCFNMDADSVKESCTIYGTEGSIEFSFYGAEVLLRKAGRCEGFAFEAEKHVQKPMIHKVVDYFMGRGSNPCCVQEALKVAQIMNSFS